MPVEPVNAPPPIPRAPGVRRERRRREDESDNHDAPHAHERPVESANGARKERRDDSADDDKTQIDEYV